jgi:hypothetical protein
LAGARKFTDLDLVATCLKKIAGLWREGENLLSYFHREIASCRHDRPLLSIGQA